MKHGTYDGYNNHDCRCDACREAGRAYRGSVQRRPHADSCHVSVDQAALLREISPRSINSVERNAGLSRGAMRMVLRRGRCTLATFDAICGALGLNGYEIEEES